MKEDKQMKQALVSMAKALGQAVHAYYDTFTPATSALLVALADWVRENDASDRKE